VASREFGFEFKIGLPRNVSCNRRYVEAPVRHDFFDSVMLKIESKAELERKSREQAHCPVH
jgi:hypothetical protein